MNRFQAILNVIQKSKISQICAINLNQTKPSSKQRWLEEVESKMLVKCPVNVGHEEEGCFKEKT